MQSYCWREMLIISEKNYIRYDLMKNSLSDEQKNALKYVANSEKRGIIKASLYQLDLLIHRIACTIIQK